MKVHQVILACLLIATVLAVGTPRRRSRGPRPSPPGHRGYPFSSPSQHGGVGYVPSTYLLGGMSSRPASPRRGNGRSDTCAAEKVWVIAYDFWEDKQEPTGREVTGISVDLIDAVCQEAGVTCRHVFDNDQYCWNSATGQGLGLQVGWYDGCAMFYQTAARLLRFDYSGLFLQQDTEPGQFYRKVGSSASVSNIANLDVNTLSSTSFYDEQCLIAYSKNAQSVSSESQTDALYALRSAGLADLIFTKRGELDGVSGIEAAPGPMLDCLLAPSGVMHRADSNLPDWFRPAYHRALASGRLSAICHSYPSITDCIF